MHTLDELGNVIGKQLGLPHLPGHFQTIVYSFGIFTVVYLVSALTSPFVAPKTYPKLSQRTKHSWNVHTVSMVHAVVIGPMAAHRLLTLPEVGSFEKAFGWNESMGLLHGIAVGFVWDTIESVLAQVEVGFIIHGLACTLIFGLSYVSGLASMFGGLRMKLRSTAAIHGFLRPVRSRLGTFHSVSKQYLDKLQMTGGLLQAVNGIILLGVFFAVRVCYGLYMSFVFFQTLLDVYRSIPIGITLTYGLGNIALNVLNLFWFTKMIAALRKRFGKAGQGNKVSNGNSRIANKVRNE
ncbi:unnamed protein product [Rhizoctonia solani]|nr:unnamed protein product [Rhizoctonia solani]